jgi:hypothetical protein
MLGASVGTREQRVLPAERDRADGVLDGVVVEFDAAVIDEARQALPARQGTTDGLGKLAFLADQAEFCAQPGRFVAACLCGSRSAWRNSSKSISRTTFRRLLSRNSSISASIILRAPSNNPSGASAPLPYDPPDGSRQALLQSSALSVTQIGIQIGFRETSSFTRAFRRFTGPTPTEYRRQRED